MKQTLVWVLIAANVSLAGTLAWRGIRENAASAEPTTAAPPARASEPGKYVLIPGESQTGVAIVYVFDSANGRLGAIAPDSKDMLSGMPTVQLKPVFDSITTGGVRPNGEGNGTRGGTRGAGR